MKGIATWTAATVLASASLGSGHGGHGGPPGWGGGWDLGHEHMGDVFSHAHGSSCPDGVLHSGNSTGTTREVNGESLYLAYPPGRKRKTDTAILYLTDVFGPQLVNNRLLADSLAKAGYLVVLPDLFHGDPVPADALSDPNSTFDFAAWQQRHPLNATEAVITSTINSIRSEFNATKIGAVGYCFGGRFVARYLAEGRGIDAGFTAHPSQTQSSEWAAIANPISIAFGALDASNTPENRTNIEQIFQDGNKTYQTNLYANAEHGFAVRTNLSVPTKAFAQESAYFQAVRWLDAWVKGDI